MRRLGWPVILMIAATPYLFLAWGAVDDRLPGPHGDDPGNLHRMRDELVACAFLLSLIANCVLSHVLALMERLRNSWQFLMLNSCLLLTILVAVAMMLLERWR